jgi:hypothetical protein
MGISIKVKAKGDTIGGWPDEDAEFNPLVTAFLEKNKGPFDIQAFQKFIREQRKK